MGWDFPSHPNHSVIPGNFFGAEGIANSPSWFSRLQAIPKPWWFGIHLRNFGIPGNRRGMGEWQRVHGTSMVFQECHGIWEYPKVTLTPISGQNLGYPMIP